MKIRTLSLLALLAAPSAFAADLNGVYTLQQNDCMGFEAVGATIQIEASNAGLEIEAVLPAGNSIGEGARQMLASYRGGDHVDQLLGDGTVHTIGSFQGNLFTYAESYANHGMPEALARTVIASLQGNELTITQSGDTAQPLVCKLVRQ